MYVTDTILSSVAFNLPTTSERARDASLLNLVVRGEGGRVTTDGVIVVVMTPLVIFVRVTSYCATVAEVVRMLDVLGDLLDPVVRH